MDDIITTLIYIVVCANQKQMDHFQLDKAHSQTYHLTAHLYLVENNYVQ